MMENFVNLLNTQPSKTGEKQATETGDTAEVVAGFAALFINQMEAETPAVELSVGDGLEMPVEGAETEAAPVVLSQPQLSQAVLPDFGKAQPQETPAEPLSGGGKTLEPALEEAPVAPQSPQPQSPVAVQDFGKSPPLDVPGKSPETAPQIVPKPGKFQPLEVPPESAPMGTEKVEGGVQQEAPAVAEALTTLADAVPLRQLVRGDKRLSPKLQAIASDLLAVRTENVDSSTVSRAPAPMAEPMPQAVAVSEQTMRLEALTERFDQRVLSMVQRDEKVMKISLKPAALGRLTVVCREEGSGLSIEIHAQSNAVRELLAQQEDAVRRLMQEHDVELDSFSTLLDEGGGEYDRRFQQEREEKMAESSMGSGGIRPALNKEGNAHTVRFAARNGAVSWVA